MLRSIDAALLDRLTAEARESSRLRRNYNFHQPEERIQRMLQAFEPETYLAPHKHEAPDKLEVFLCLRGRVALLTFDDAGAVADVCVMQPGGPEYGAEVPPRVWHSLVSLEPGSAIYEVLDGPYVPNSGIVFAPWAPAEGDPEAPVTRERLRTAALAARPAGGPGMLRRIDAGLLDWLSRKAGDSPRRRCNYNFHRLDEPIQRMLNALEPDTRVRPHKHEAPDKVEAFICLRGRVAVLSFHDTGTPAAACILTPGGAMVGAEVPPRSWHTLVGLDPGTVVFEVKDGPYDPGTDKQFAPWAPEEGSPAAQDYRERLRAGALGQRPAPAVPDNEESLEAVRADIDGGLMADAEEAAARVVALAAEWVDANPSPQLALLLEGERQAQAANWEAAQTAYRRAVATAISAHHEVQPRWHLADLHRAHGRHLEALQEARAATAAARRTRWGTVIAMALLKEASCSLAGHDAHAALSAAQDALALIAENPYQHLLRARILTFRARCRAAMGNLPGADEDLAAAGKALQARPDPSRFAGMQRGLAYWWSATASLRRAREEWRGAIEAQRASIRHWRWVSQLPHTAGSIPQERMAEAIRSLAELYQAAGDEAAAEAALAESRRIRGSLGLPENGGS